MVHLWRSAAGFILLVVLITGCSSSAGPRQGDRSVDLAPNPAIVAAMNVGFVQQGIVTRELRLPAVLTRPEDDPVIANLDPGNPEASDVDTADLDTADLVTTVLVPGESPIAAGDLATVFNPASAAAPASAEVRYVTATADANGTASAAVTVSVESSSSLRSGTDVVVLLTGETVPDALWVVPDAVRNFRGRSYILATENADGGELRRVDVTIGATSQDRIQVTDTGNTGDTGNAGDNSSDNSLLQPGLAVMLR